MEIRMKVNNGWNAYMVSEVYVAGIPDLEILWFNLRDKWELYWKIPVISVSGLWFPM